jgi:hypothetical protein
MPIAHQSCNMALEDICRQKPKIPYEQKATYKCDGCNWVDYGCQDYEPKPIQQLELFKKEEYK